MDQTNVLTATPITVITTVTITTRIISTIGETGITEPEMIGDRSTLSMEAVRQTRGGTARIHRQTPGIMHQPQVMNHFKEIGPLKRQGTA